MAIALITHPDCLLHDMGELHPEQPSRLHVIQEALEKSELKKQLLYYTAPLVTYEQLSRAHDTRYIDTIFALSPKEGLIALDPDTLMNPHTLTAALYAAGAGVLGVNLVMSGIVKAAFCNVRPPGHHAERSKAMGFCFFNNVVVAALYALDHYHLNRVAIIDFDVHHGNGTENIIQHDERILYCSSFQHPFYPFCGTETKNAHVLNIALPAGTSSQHFRDKIKEQWFDEILSFQPDIIFFSAGFDAYQYDDMSELLLTEEDYAWLTASIKKIADIVCRGRMVSMLEGGYDLNGLGRCVVAHLAALCEET